MLLALWEGFVASSNQTKDNQKGALGEDMMLMRLFDGWLNADDEDDESRGCVSDK